MEKKPLVTDRWEFDVQGKYVTYGLIAVYLIPESHHWLAIRQLLKIFPLTFCMVSL
jgi:hypothetical protein